MKRVTFCGRPYPLSRLGPGASLRPFALEQPRAAAFTTTIARGEILYGIRVLPASKRRDGLWEAARRIFEIDFEGQVLSFEISATRRAAGRPISHFDAQIASIARSRGAEIATRNVREFEGCGLEVLDPWGKS